MYPKLNSFDLRAIEVNQAYAELKEWAEDELRSGNRLKASRIDRAAERIRARREASP